MRIVGFIFLPLGFLIFSFTNCTKAPPERAIVLDNREPKKFYAEDLFPSWRLVKLGSLISSVNDLILHNNKIYVLDRALTTIKIFSNSGDFLKSIEGDVFENGKPLQPVCMVITHTSKIMFYDAASESFVWLDDGDNVGEVQKSLFYCSKIYPFKDGYLIFKNQFKQENETEEFWYNVLITDGNFKVNERLFPFFVEKNVPRTWTHFDDPITITNDGFEFFEPFKSYYVSYHYNSKAETINLQFETNGLPDATVNDTDLSDPEKVLHDLFERYSLLNNKRLVASSYSGWRIISKGAVHFIIDKPASDRAVSQLFLKQDGKDLLVPFPVTQIGETWVSILDPQNYETLNLPDYSNLHPIVNQIITQGDSYLLFLNTNQ